jgi:hypothetical protein
MGEVLGSGAWYNRSRKVLLAVGVSSALFFFLFCASTAYFVGQYFVCIDGCGSATPSILLIAVSAFFGMIPAVGTGAIGYFIVKGLLDDSRMEQAKEAQPAPQTEQSPAESQPLPRPN